MNFDSSRRLFFRTSAWVVIQALVLSPILSPFSYADSKPFLSQPTLRAPQRADSPEGRRFLQSGLEEVERLGDVVQLDKVQVIRPTGPVDFSNGAALFIDAGVAKRFRDSVVELIQEGELPGGSETNKLLVNLKGRPAGVWPKLATKRLGLAVVSVVGMDRERVMTAYRKAIPDVIFTVQAKRDGTPWPAGTGHAAFFGLAAIPQEKTPFVLVTAGDQPLYGPEEFGKVIQAFQQGQQLDPPVDLVMAHAVFDDPTGKGRVVEDSKGSVLGILEEKAIKGGTTLGGYSMEQLLDIKKGNVSIYVISPRLLHQLLAEVEKNKDTGEYFLTDIVEKLLGEVGERILGRKGRVISVEIPKAKAPDLSYYRNLKEIEASFVLPTGLEEIPEAIGFKPLGGHSPEEILKRTKVAIIGGGRFIRVAFLDRVLGYLNDIGQYDGLAVLVQPVNSDFSERINRDGFFETVTAHPDGQLKRRHLTTIVGAGSLGDSRVGVLRPGESGQQAFHRYASLPIEVIGVSFSEAGLKQGSKSIRDLAEFLREIHRADQEVGKSRKLSVIDFDNVPENGNLLESLVLQEPFVREDPPLRQWIRQDVTFHNTVPDTMTLETEIDVPLAEPPPKYIGSLIIEDVKGVLPAAFQKAPGVVVVRQPGKIQKYHEWKLRLLIAIHTAMVPLRREGFQDTFQAIQDPRIRAYLDRLFENAILPAVRRNPGLRIEGKDPQQYYAEWMGRLQNPHIKIPLSWLGQNLPDKLVYRIFPTIRDLKDTGYLSRWELAFAVASILADLTPPELFGASEEALRHRLDEQFSTLSQMRGGLDLRDPAYAMLMSKIVDLYLEMVGQKKPILEVLASTQGQQAGLEEIPLAANPLSAQFQPGVYEIASPMNRFTPPPVFDGTSFNPVEVVDALERTFREDQQGHVSIRFPLNRVAGRGKLWDKIPDKEKLEALYDLQYDLFERRQENVLSERAVQQVVGSFNDPNPAVASAARDVVVSVRAYHLTETLKRLTTEYSAQSAGFGSYARVSWQDAMTTLIDPSTQTELGNPHRPLFDGEPNVERIHQILQFLFDPDRRDTWLKSFSGIRGPFSLGMENDGSRFGFPSGELSTEIGSQIMDSAKVATAHILREFVKLLPTLPKDQGGVEPDKKLRIGILMDPRYTGPAIAQVIIRILHQIGVDVVFGGIGSAPETAAYALLSQGKVDAAVLISSSHVQEGTNGFKLMVSNGQILPQDVARRFIKSFIQSAKSIENTRELIQLLSDKSIDSRVEEVIHGMPAIYAESKERYNHYGDQVISDEFENDARMQEIKQRTRKQLEDQKVVVLYDPNGGSGVADLEFFRSWAPYLITLNDQARHFAHDLAPQEVSTRQAKEVVAKLEAQLRSRGYTVLIFGTDTDRDRRFMLFRTPTQQPGQPREYIYPGPQALFILDAIYHVLTNRRAGKDKLAIVGNDPTTPLLEILAPLMHYEWKKGEVGEANVVAVMREFIEKGYEVMGGEGSNASTIRYPVMVRDMLLALGSVFGFMGENGPVLVRDLIELVVKDDVEKQRLQGQVEEWFGPENRPELFYHILYDILPPAAVTDTFDVSEQRKGIGIPQRDFKNALDTVVQDQLGLEIRSAVAQEIGRVTGQSVSAPQVRYKIVNYEGTERLEGAGNRKTNEGGYLVELYYTDEAGKEHYLGWLWTRESQTELGTARRIVALVVDFLPQAQSRQLVDSLYNTLYPKWIDALNSAEALAMWRILSGPAASGEIEKLAKLTEETRANTAESFHELEAKYTDPDKPADYSENVARNLREEKLRVEAAHWMLGWISSRTREPLSALNQTGAEIESAGRINLGDVQHLKEHLSSLRGRFNVTARRSNHVASQNLMLWSYQQVMERVLAGFREDQLTETADKIQVTSLVRQIKILSDIHRAIDAIAKQPRDRYAHVHLVVGETLLAGAKAAAGLEELPFEAQDPFVAIEQEASQAVERYP